MDVGEGERRPQNTSNDLETTTAIVTDGFNLEIRRDFINVPTPSASCIYLNIVNIRFNNIYTKVCLIEAKVSIVSLKTYIVDCRRILIGARID